MSVLGGLKSLFTGDTGIVSSIAGLVKDYFPPDLSAEKKAELEEKIRNFQLQAQKQVDDATSVAEQNLTQRIAELEGTASDLKAIPFFGPLMLFLRGLQRPAWGFSTLYMDFMWFSEWATLSQKQESALMVINVLVLGFLFGERAIKNVMPLITKLFEAKGKG
ncbi:hypothetical protein V6238_01660 [Marinomonas arenicola]|uniref:hypothetical protein n=1 Tax=Marinomonas arenicola TaxID=569601 RepID=UPI00311E30F1